MNNVNNPRMLRNENISIINKNNLEVFENIFMLIQVIPEKLVLQVILMKDAKIVNG